MEANNWGFAARCLDDGFYVRRGAWEKGVWVFLEKGEPREDGFLIDDTTYDCPQLVRLSPPSRMRPTRELYRLSYGDIMATDWCVSREPNLLVRYDVGELIMAAKTGRPVHFHPHTDMLQQNGFVAIGDAPPGWEYVTVRLAVRSVEEGNR